MNTCICCGAPIAEDRQVCKICENRFRDNFSTADYIAGHTKGYNEGARDCYLAILNAASPWPAFQELVSETFARFVSANVET